MRMMPSLQMQYKNLLVYKTGWLFKDGAQCKIEMEVGTYNLSTYNAGCLKSSN